MSDQTDRDLFGDLVPKTETQKAIEAAVETFKRELETSDEFEYRLERQRGRPMQWEGRADLVHAALKKPIRKVMQVDVFTNQKEDDVSKPDDDGDEMSCVEHEELRNMECVRIQFPSGWTRADVMRTLAKAIEWMKDDEFWQYHEHAQMAMALWRTYRTFGDAIDGLDMSGLGDGPGEGSITDDPAF